VKLTGVVDFQSSNLEAEQVGQIAMVFKEGVFW
jgi:hypothetical protein